MKRLVLACLLLLVTSITYAAPATNICTSVGLTLPSIWSDYWKPGMYPGYGFYQNSLCPTWTTRFPNGVSGNGVPQCYAMAPIPAMNTNTSTTYGHCRQPSQIYTQECLNAEGCQVSLQYAQGNLGSVCQPIIDLAISTWNDPQTLDCNNMNRKWKDSYGAVWYIANPNRSNQVTGWIDTNQSYWSKGRCGWWQITGTKSDKGYTYLTIVAQTQPRKTCLKQTAYSGTTTASQSTGTFLNGAGQQGVITIYSQEPPPGFTWMNWTPLQPASVGGAYNPYEQ